MGRGLSQLQKTILVQAADPVRHAEKLEQDEQIARNLARWYAERGKSDPSPGRASARQLEREAAGIQDDYIALPWHAFEAHYGVDYVEVDVTNSMTVAVCKAFKRLQERGLLSKKLSWGWPLTTAGLEKARELMAKSPNLADLADRPVS